MSKVVIMPLKEGGKVGAYNTTEGKEPWGFIHVQSVQHRFVNGIYKNEQRDALLKGPITGLTAVANSGNTIEGKIVVKEYLESEIPADLAKREFSPTRNYEENISSRLKRAGKDGDILTKGGERIVRFIMFTDNLAETDITVQHDPVTVVNGATPETVITLPAEATE